MAKAWFFGSLPLFPLSQTRYSPCDKNLSKLTKLIIFAVGLTLGTSLLFPHFRARFLRKDIYYHYDNDNVNYFLLLLYSKNVRLVFSLLHNVSSYAHLPFIKGVQ